MNQAAVVLKEAPEVDYDPFAPENREDPFPLYEALREVAPVFYLSKYGTYGVARWQEVTAVQKDYENFTATTGSGLSDIRSPDSWREGATITSSDPPKHTEIRSILNRILSPVVVRQWREIFEEEGRKLVERLVKQGEFDAVCDLSEAFVTYVFPKALGIEITQEQAVAIGDLNFNALGPQNDLLQKSVEQTAPLQDYIARSRTREFVDPDGWADQMFDAEAQGAVPPGTASSLMLALVRGGMDTTISGIGTTIAQLAQNPDQWALLRDDPSKARAAFEEAIRIEAPIQGYYRATTRELELSGYRLKNDVKVHMMVGSANRDPRKFPDPARYDITRDTAGHAALGTGVHNCVGQMIARLEAESVLKPLAEMVSEIRIEGPMRHRHNNMLRTYASLPAKVTLK